jgi:E3 ubiquitin-protein ligase RAD18
MLKDTALRKKMGELGLSASGPRPLLEKRHQEWITLWNANCDSAKPKKRSELMNDLDVWERTMGGLAPTMSRAANMGAQIKQKDFDGAAWATKHDTSFRDLIAKARGSRAQAGQKAAEPSAGSLNEVGPAQLGESVDTASYEPTLPAAAAAAAAAVATTTPAVVDLTELPPSSQAEPPDSPPGIGLPPRLPL